MFSEPIYIPQALNTGTCIRQGDLFYSAGPHRNHVLATANTAIEEVGDDKWLAQFELACDADGVVPADRD